MCTIVKAVGGPSLAELLRAIEWSGSPGQPMLCFQVTGGQLVESLEYRVFMISANLFVIALRTTHGEALELIWDPVMQRGRCISAFASV